MKILHITLKERNGIRRTAEPVSIGVPFSQGVIPQAQLICLRDEDAAEIPFDIDVTALWPDGSVRWCLLSFQVCVSAHAHKRVDVMRLREARPAMDAFPLMAATGVSECTLQTDKLRLAIPTRQLVWRSEGQSNNRNPGVASVIFNDQAGGECRCEVDGSMLSAERARSRIRLTQRGAFVADDGASRCRFESAIELFAGTSTLRWHFTLHNDGAAEHGGGLWDLGDSGSVFFRELALRVGFPLAAASRYQMDVQQDWEESAGAASLLQASSGGDNWQSRNHVNYRGEQPLLFRGFRFVAEDIQREGTRASPIVFNGAGCSVYVERFWQQFPKAITTGDGALTVHLFPAQAADMFELQGGERKTHTVYLDFSGDPDALAWARFPLEAQISPEYIAATGCILYFAQLQEPIDAVVEVGLSGDENFFVKRERIDEYGWRNFGDVFADHESLYLEGGQRYISHYNNQYDTLYGFIRQYLHSGNPAWWELASDLARHVVDIDIYNTKADRAEYNGGLFWHTDHYVDACTASHRTYSRLQKPLGNGAPAGGGPGPEHCYSHGLLLHYYLTGTPASKAAVLSLTDWMICVYEGSGAVVERLLQIRARVLPKMREASNGKKTLNHSLPMNRGVGNYINTVLDSFLLTGEARYLAQVESIVRRTVHPLDIVADRNFDDVELTWHYTVFLQAVIRYVETKQLWHQAGDAAYCYALDSVLHYASWMEQNESPYLHHPERLEFPNDTWAAQDIRKAHILYFASRHGYTQADRARFKVKANHFYEYVVTQLARSPTRHFTRILGILMQNHGPRAYYGDATVGAAVEAAPMNYSSSPYATRGELILQACGVIGKALLRFSLKRELGWLRYRSSLFNKVYLRLYG